MGICQRRVVSDSENWTLRGGSTSFCQGQSAFAIPYTVSFMQGLCSSCNSSPNSISTSPLTTSNGRPAKHGVNCFQPQPLMVGILEDDDAHSDHRYRYLHSSLHPLSFFPCRRPSLGDDALQRLQNIGACVPVLRHISPRIGSPRCCRRQFRAISPPFTFARLRCGPVLVVSCLTAPVDGCNRGMV